VGLPVGLPVGRRAGSTRGDERMNAMDLFWRCTCGEEFDEPGDRTGYGAMVKHTLYDHRGDPDHKGDGLWSRDTGEQLVRGQAINQAIQKGYVEAKEGGKHQGKRKAAQRGAAFEEERTRKGKASGRGPIPRWVLPIQDRELDETLIIYYDIFRARFPDYDQPFERFILDAVTAFMFVFDDDIGFSELIRQVTGIGADGSGAPAHGC